MVEIKNVIKSLHLVSGAKNKSNSFFLSFCSTQRESRWGGGGGVTPPVCFGHKAAEPLSSSMIDK